MCWGAVWRATAWGLLAGTVIGAIYGVAVGIGYLGTGSGIGILGFAPGGATFGLIGGMLAGLADGIGIAAITAMSPPHPNGQARYLSRVRVTAAVFTLLTGALLVGFAAPYSLSLPGIFFFDVPTPLAMAVSYAMAPRAVEWFLHAEPPAGSPSP